MKNQGAIVGLLARFSQLMQDLGRRDTEEFLDFDGFSTEDLDFGL